MILWMRDWGIKECKESNTNIINYQVSSKPPVYFIEAIPTAALAAPRTLPAIVPLTSAPAPLPVGTNTVRSPYAATRWTSMRRISISRANWSTTSASARALMRMASASAFAASLVASACASAAICVAFAAALAAVTTWYASASA